MVLDTSEPLALLAADWPAPANVRALTTLRGDFAPELGSPAGYRGFNLGAHCGDDPSRIARHRAQLAMALQLPSAPVWLQQVHGTAVLELGDGIGFNSVGVNAAPPVADASFSRSCDLSSDAVCVVLTADCLPVLFTDRTGAWIAAAHAGWRGLAAGVLEATVATYHGSRSELMAWLGPAIGPQVFEVGEEVRAAFVADDAGAEAAFIGHGNGKYRADLYALARRRLQAAGISAIYGGTRCTFSDSDAFYSYRREPVCGRMASLIWREPEQA